MTFGWLTHGPKGLTSTSTIPLLVITSLLLIGDAYLTLTGVIAGTLRESIRILCFREERQPWFFWLLLCREWRIHSVSLLIALGCHNADMEAFWFSLAGSLWLRRLVECSSTLESPRTLSQLLSRRKRSKSITEE